MQVNCMEEPVKCSRTAQASTVKVDVIYLPLLSGLTGTKSIVEDWPAIDMETSVLVKASVSEMDTYDTVPVASWSQTKMEQFRQIEEALGSLKALMVFSDNIQINQRQCVLLLDMLDSASSTGFSKKGKPTSRNAWKPKTAIESVAELSGWEQDEMQKKKRVYSNKYHKEWIDSQLFQWKFAKQHLVTQDFCNRIDSVWKEDRWILRNKILEKENLGLRKQERNLADLLLRNLDSSELLKEKLLPSSILLGSKDYQVRRRLGNGNQYKEVYWLVERKFSGRANAGKNFGIWFVFHTTKSTDKNQNEQQLFIWHAPEVLEEQEQPGSKRNFNLKFTEKADVHSFGMICFHLLTGKVPFEDGHLQGDKMGRNIRVGERPLFPYKPPKPITNLIKKCWHADQAQRPSFPSVCRILRYLKRSLLMNPDHNYQSELPLLLVDYHETDSRLQRMFPVWEASKTVSASQIPFQMFIYRVLENEKIGSSHKDTSESGSERNEFSGNENVTTDEPYLSATERSMPSPEPLRRIRTTVKKSPDIKAKHSVTPKGRLLRPPTIHRAHSFIPNSENNLLVSPRYRKSSENQLLVSPRHRESRKPALNKTQNTENEILSCLRFRAHHLAFSTG
ncbi:Nucleotide-sugar transporter family protein [Hibiscus syriacus]|uniref:Nucleotide-sugar transporter family protein n=1 Tax=Hibiscus syriacus TaxID=106335 RepID=A0A6A2ZPR5_HIBSY|nr:Nucleotide-sugar transporter family protein [Hibiscus syriacus]